MQPLKCRHRQSTWTWTPRGPLDLRSFPVLLSAPSSSGGLCLAVGINSLHPFYGNLLLFWHFLLRLPRGPCLVSCFFCSLCGGFFRVHPSGLWQTPQWGILFSQNANLTHGGFIPTFRNLAFFPFLVPLWGEASCNRDACSCWVVLGFWWRCFATAVLFYCFSYLNFMQ